MKHRITVFLVLPLLLAACGSPSSPDAVQSSEPGEGGAAGDVLPSELPLVSLLTPEPAVVGPGETVQIHGVSGLSGTLILTDPAGGIASFDFTDGVSEIVTPGSAADGLYRVVLQNENGDLAMGGFRVSSEPGVWVTASRRYTRPGQPATFTITAFDLPPDAVAAVYLGQVSDGGSGSLVPDENGTLFPGEPIPWAELTGQPLLLPRDYAGPVQAAAQPGDQGSAAGITISDEFTLSADPRAAFEGWASNLVQLESCEQPGTVRGNLGGPGFVNSIWADGTLQSSSGYTADGSFALEAGPGVVLVQSFPMDGESAAEPTSEMVVIGCGQAVEMGRVGGGTYAASRPASAIHDTSFQPGGLTLASLSPRLPLAQGAGGEPCRTGIIFPRVSDANGVNPLHTTLAGIALKTALNEAASAATVNTLGDARALLEAIGQAQLQDPDGGDWEDLEQALQSMADADFVISLNASRTGQRYSVNTVALPTLPEDRTVRGSGQGSAGALFDTAFSAYSELADKFRQAAICGKAYPEQAKIEMGEELSISYQVTDLAGEGADGANVKISPPECGQLDPDNGTVEGETFTTQFSFHTDEYCTEALAFEATWSGPQGQVQTKQDESVVHVSPDLPELTLYAGAAPGIGNTATLASAITLQEDYEVTLQPASLPAFTQDPTCSFLEGGLELGNQWYFARSESSSKRADALFEAYTSADVADPRADAPANRAGLYMELDTWAIEFENDNVIRGAWASGANSSDPNLTHTPGTLLVFDLSNPGKLPTTPIVSWQLGGSIDKASDFSILVFYKVVECGDDPAIGSLFSFVGDGDILLEAEKESPGRATGLVTLPEFDGEREQIIMWATTLLTSASLRDDDSDANIVGRGKLHFNLSVNLAQELD